MSEQEGYVVFRLDERGKPIVEPDIATWWQWMCDNGAARLIGHDWVDYMEVLTTFVGHDPLTHRQPPWLYETVTKGVLGWEGLSSYYPDAESARQGHREAVASVGVISRVGRHNGRRPSR